MDGNDMIPFIEPIFQFCYQRLRNRYDAEDLASEILCYSLDGIGKYKIESLDAWVWRIAHNRYARFIDARKKARDVFSDQELYEIESDYCQVDEESIEEKYEPVFRCLHTLSSGYRNIFVDYYIGEMSVKQLSQKYSLPETTVKWRLNVGRNKIKERIGENQMDKVYQRINWNTNGCNGSMDSNRYLHRQIARAICKAAYETPLTVEEISLCTGIPTIYIEDELPKLEYGDAVRKIGNKYGTEFIVFRLKDRIATEAEKMPMVKAAADYCEEMLLEKKDEVGRLGFYGCEFGMQRLGYILVPYFIRQKLQDLKKNHLNLLDGEFPPRKDGGYGWFHVEETADESEKVGWYNMGCAIAGDNSSSQSEKGGHIYYYWIEKYRNESIDQNGGIKWLCAHKIPQSCQMGYFCRGVLAEEDIVRLLGRNLIVKDGGRYKLNFACFTKQQFADFCALTEDDGRLDKLLCGWILSVRKHFESFVPKRLHSQINQWISCYCGELVSYVVEELIERGRLEKPKEDQALADGIFYVEGECMFKV